MWSGHTEKGKKSAREAADGLKLLLPLLRARGQTFACAESCTGGLLSAVIASFAGVSDVYLGSIVAYANQLKQDFLDVPKTLIAAHGAVSAPVAKAMAEGVRKRMHADWAVSITGIAGPNGGSEDKPIGTVWIAVIGPGFERVERYQLLGVRTEIQSMSALQAVLMLRQAVGLEQFVAASL
jgi:nicotinamide-nucleotide amidase